MFKEIILVCAAICTTSHGMQSEKVAKCSQVKHALFGRMALAPVSPAHILRIEKTRQADHICDSTCCHPITTLKKLAVERNTQQAKLQKKDQQ